MHPSAYIFASRTLTADQVAGKRVVEAGAYDYNGSARAAITAMVPASYTGTDAQAGPGVDLVCAAEDLPGVLGDAVADVVVCTEMLEHAGDWRAAVSGIARVLAPGGLLLLTTRSPGFPYHPHPEDHWRFSLDVMDGIVEACGLEVLELDPDPDWNAPGVFLLARKPLNWDGAGMAEGLAVVEPRAAALMLAHFYHIWADGAWQAPLAEHLEALDASGLGTALDYKAAGVVGQPANCQAAIGALGSDWQIAVTAGTGYEEVTIRKLHAFAALDGKAFYAHTKGAADPQRRNTLWRRRMTWCCTSQWELAVAALDSYDCAGPHWLTAMGYWEVPSPPWRCWFGGNFWWANLSWLRRLPVPGGGDRYAAERWIGESLTPRVLDMLPGRPLDGLENWAATTMLGDEHAPAVA